MSEEIPQDPSEGGRTRFLQIIPASTHFAGAKSLTQKKKNKKNAKKAAEITEIAVPTVVTKSVKLQSHDKENVPPLNSALNNEKLGMVMPVNRYSFSFHSIDPSAIIRAMNNSNLPIDIRMMIALALSSREELLQTVVLWGRFI
jgi:hypothetical protein